MIVITTPTGEMAAKCSATCSTAANSSGSSPLDPSQLPAEVRDDLDIVEGSLATRRMSTRHSPAPMPSSG
jgi:hypothetical protein